MAIEFGELDPEYLAVALLSVTSIVVFVYKLYVVHGERDTLLLVVGPVLVTGAALAAAAEPATTGELAALGNHGLAMVYGLFAFAVFFSYHRLEEREDILDDGGQEG